MEEILSERLQLVTLHAEIGFAITRGGTLRSILQRCTEALVQSLDVTFVRIWTLNKKKNVLELQSSAGMYTHIDGDHSIIPVGMHEIGLIAKERNPYLTNAVIGDPKVHNQEWAKRECIVAFAGYPLVVEDRFIGVIALFSKKKLQEDMPRILSSLSDTIAIGITCKQTEESLRKSEERFTEVQRIAHIGNWEQDMVTNEICWSDEMYHIFGLKPQEYNEITYERFLNCVHPADREFVKKSINDALYEKKPYEIDYRVIHKDKTIRDVHSKALVTFDHTGNPIRITGTVQDITDRKRVEEELRLERNKLQLVIDAMEDGLTIQDLDYNIIYQNKVLTNRFGVRLGYKCYSSYESKNTVCDGCPVEMVYKDGKPHISERRVVTPSGEIIYVENIACPIKDGSGKIVYGLEVCRNITGRKQAEETKTRLSAIIEAATDFIGTANTDGAVLYINKAGRKIIGIGEDEDISNLKIPDFHPKWASDLIMHDGISTAIREGVWTGETAFLSRDGREIPFSQVIIAHKTPNGTTTDLSIIARDISERKKHESQILYMANQDPLTNLFNRRHFQEELEHWLAETRRFGTKGALLFLDIDNFKDINDSFSHQVGDKLLINLSNLMKTRLRRNTDILARLGGDEFAIILPHVDLGEAKLIANQILELAQHNTLVEKGILLHITVSIGIALFPDHGIKAETLLASVDLAMYLAKKKGRNRVCVYTHDLKTKIESRLFWEKSICEAFKQDRFVIYLQPILDLHQNCIIGHEALLRMIDERGNLILPADFLNVAEHLGLIHDINRWVSHNSIRLIEKFQKENKPAHLEINLSGNAFADTELLSIIREEIKAANINPSNAVFEITETVLIDNLLTAQDFIIDLKTIGCRFALDDFGIGFSSFNYLKHLPVDYLKIDGDFINHLPRNPIDQHLVKATVEIARGLGIKTIAEFVNNEETIRLLKEFGVNYAQGYHIGKPFAAPG